MRYGITKLSELASILNELDDDDRLSFHIRDGNRMILFAIRINEREITLHEVRIGGVSDLSNFR